MSNNNKTIIIGLLILVGVGGLFAYRMMASSTNSNEPLPQEPVVQNEQSNESTPSAQNTENSDDKNTTYAKFVTTMAPTGSRKYVLSNNSQASYAVTKVFVGKPQADVVGITEDVEGAGWYDTAGKKFYLKAEVGLDTLKSDSEKRDSDILPLFTPATATIVLNGDNATDAISMTEPFETQLTADLTIGTVTKSVVFDVKGMIDENKFTAEGTTLIKMSEFGITPPSALNIFTVEDDTTLKFTVEGEALEEVTTQE